jgi:hypothetical protein
MIVEIALVVTTSVVKNTLYQKISQTEKGQTEKACPDAGRLIPQPNNNGNDKRNTPKSPNVRGFRGVRLRWIGMLLFPFGLWRLWRMKFIRTGQRDLKELKSGVGSEFYIVQRSRKNSKKSSSVLILLSERAL